MIQPVTDTGATGNPPRIPGLPPIASFPISQFLNGPGPIYSGIPINGNADPLSLDSGRAVTGGYAGTSGDIGFGDCGCEAPPVETEGCGHTVETEGCDSCNAVGEGIPFNPVGGLATPIYSEAVNGMPQEFIPEGLPIESLPVQEGEGEAEAEAEASNVEDDQTQEGESEPGQVKYFGDPSFLKRFTNWLSV